MSSQSSLEGGNPTYKDVELPSAHLDDSELKIFRDATSMLYRPIDAITSYLGDKNPHSHPVDGAEHTVWLLDNTAHRPAAGQPWQAEFVAAYFVKNSGRNVSDFVADVVEKVGLGGERGESRQRIEERVAERLQPLLDAVLPAHTVDVEIGGMGKVVRLGPSGRSGVSRDLVLFDGEHEDGSTILTHALGVPSVDCTTTFASSTGWAIISDIDDTIKVTQTPSAIGILKTTFIEDAAPIAGMPELYAYIASTLSTHNNPPPFWYLSASPYNLYPFLHTFMHTHYPPGPLLLREASWMHLAAFLSSLTQGTQAYKVDRMKRLHDAFPNRRFLAVGDSTQSDPEAYGEICRTWPGWIRKVWIRKVKGIAGMDEERKNGDERFEMAFRGVRREVWRVFEEPEELYGEVDRLV